MLRSNSTLQDRGSNPTVCQDFFAPMAINMHNFEFSKILNGNLATLKNEMKKAVAPRSLSERECNLIKLVLQKQGVRILYYATLHTNHATSGQLWLETPHRRVSLASFPRPR